MSFSLSEHLRASLPATRHFVLMQALVAGFQVLAAESLRPEQVEPPELGKGPWNLRTELADIHVEIVANGLEHPWGMAFLPDGDILVTERPGRLRIIRDGVLDPDPVSGLPAVHGVVFGGLLDVTLHPDFENNSLVYFSYSKSAPDDPALATTAVARARWDGERLVGAEDIFVAAAWYSPAMSLENERCCGQPPSDVSYGCRIEFDPDGYLFLTLGDRGWGEMAQDGNVHMGKIVRLHDDGSVPEDNPFVGKAGYRADIWTLGHRNPLSLAIHPETGEVWSAEFGAMGGDELNFIEKGKNYGWFLVSEGLHYTREPTAMGHNSVPGMEDPELFWVPAINPGNLAFYFGDAFPAWRRNLLMGAHTGSVVRFSFDGGGNPVEEERMLTELSQRIRDVTVGPDGNLYLLTDEPDGVMLRVRPEE